MRRVTIAIAILAGTLECIYLLRPSDAPAPSRRPSPSVDVRAAQRLALAQLVQRPAADSVEPVSALIATYPPGTLVYRPSDQTLVLVQGGYRVTFSPVTPEALRSAESLDVFYPQRKEP